VIRELSARVPGSQPRLLALHPVPIMAVAGDWPTLAEMGLGFDTAAAAEALNAGLGVVPRPVSFAWPEGHLVERTLWAAAGLHAGRPGAGIVAFEGDIIATKCLDATVNNLLRYQRILPTSLRRAAEGRWFIAKRLAPHGLTIPATTLRRPRWCRRTFTRPHHWGMLPQPGVRLCYVNVFAASRHRAAEACSTWNTSGKLKGWAQLSTDAPATRRLPAPDRRTMAVAAWPQQGGGASGG
jgi:hypothetical protein